MNINSRPLSLNMLANVDKFAGRLGCLEERFYLGCLGCRGLLEEMPSGGGFEGDYFGRLGCLEIVPSDDEFDEGRLFWPPGRLEVTGNIIDRNNVEHRRYHLRPGHRPRNRRHSHHPHERKRLLPDCR